MTTSLFLIRPTSLDGESLSSWRQRSGWRNGYTFFPIPDERNRRTDPDLGLYRSDLDWLAQGHGVSVEAVTTLSLRSQVGKFLERFELRAQPRWWLRARYGREQRPYGPMFCPKCLAQDSTPYFRLAWRFAFVTECVEHRCALRDQCPACIRPPWPGGVGMGVKDRISSRFDAFNICWHCGLDLSKLATSGSSSTTSSVLLHGLRTGRIVIGAQSVPVIEALHALRGICQLFLRKRARLVIAASAGKWAALTGQLSEEATRTLSVDHLRIDDRMLLVPAAWEILAGWPQSFLEFSEQTGISRMHFNGTADLQPTWMNRLIDDQLALQNRSVTANDVGQAVASWTREHGVMPSKTRLRQLLQWQGEKGLDKFFAKRDAATRAEITTFTDTARAELNKTCGQPRSHRHAVLDLAVLIFCIKRASKIDAAKQLVFDQMAVAMKDISALMPATDPLGALAADLHERMMHISIGNTMGIGAMQAAPRQVRKRLVSLMANLDSQLKRDVAVFRDMPPS